MMDSQLIQRTRYQLQARVRSVKTCPLLLFTGTTGHFLDWVSGHPLLSALLAPLAEARDGYANRMQADLAKIGTKAIDEIVGPWPTKSREDATALAIAALQATRSMDLCDNETYSGYIVAYTSAGYEPQVHENPTPEGVIEALRDVCVQGVYEYLDEAIDSRNAVLGLLVKYKTRCEMYRRHRLRDAATTGLEGRKSERALAFDLYEYLHDQGVDFPVESVSASGEPDLVSRDAHGERLVADAKYIDEGSNVRKTVTSGFRQVLEYCRDHNEPVGYLVVFVNRDVVIDIKGERDDGFPCFRTGGYTVYYVIIDIFDHGTSASKRPKPPVMELTHKDLVEEHPSEEQADVAESP